MKIGILGAGQVAKTFARKAIDAGHSIVFSNSRGPESLAEVVSSFGTGAEAGTPADAAAQELVLLAVPWPKVAATLSSIPAWSGQILIDPTNSFRDGTPASGIVSFGQKSSSQFVSDLASGARVVKAMNSLFMSNFAKAPEVLGFRRVVFISSDHLDAGETVASLIESFGFASINLGTLAKGGVIQAVGGPITGHDYFVPWPAPRSFPAFNGEDA